MQRTDQWVASIARQAAFTRGYSPLYGAILDALAGWLQGAGGEAAAGVRRRFMAFVGSQAWENDLEPILKLAAALHSYVLADDPRAASLRPYYRTVTAEDAARPLAGFAEDLRVALDRLGDDLVAAALGWEIQTNETARGVAWLLPAALLQVEAAYVVELGASAGLNLFADLRRYDLQWPDGTRVTLGQAEAPQFEISCEGPTPGPIGARGPEVLARAGVDARVVDLDAPGAERKLAACVWGDQPQRMERLQEALTLRRRYQGTELGARLVRARLPEELEEFLAAVVPSQPVAPVILFDTYVTAYFNDVDHKALVRGVEGFARPWTLRHRLPWLWVRFEPPRAGEGSAPQVGWCRWWVDVWTQGRRRTIEVGWAHPHCVKLVFGAGLTELAALRGPE